MNHDEETRQHIPEKPSRRTLLAAVGLLGGAAVCGGMAGLYLLTRPRPRVVIVAEGAVPTMPPTFEASRTPTRTPAPSPTPTSIPPRPPVVERGVWGGLVPDHDAPNESGFYSITNPEGWRIYDMELADAYQTIVIHHSVLDAESDIATLRSIQRRHRRERGWADVAYHFFVGKEGTIYEGRDMHVRGTHVAGHNTGSLGLCLLGNYSELFPTEQQLASAEAFIVWAAARLQLTHIAGHKDFNAGTECPGDHLTPYIERFALAANLQIGTGGYIAPTV